MIEQIVSFDDLVKDLKSTGLKKGDLVNVKASLKSIGKIDGGAKTLLEALIETVGKNGTIVTESFIQMYAKSQQSINNPSTNTSKSYAGALANEILKHPNMHISSHPVQRFAAVGAMAEELMNNHTIKSRPYNVLFDMITNNGVNLRIGGLDKVVGVGTTHVALDKLQIQQKRVYLFTHYLNNNKLIKFPVNWAAGCEQGFNNLFPHYYKNNAVISEGKVGNAEALITDMEKTYNIELDLFKSDISQAMCNDPSCINCRLAYKDSKKNYSRTIWSLFKRKKYKEAYSAFTFIFNSNYQPRIIS